MSKPITEKSQVHEVILHWVYNYLQKEYPGFAQLPQKDKNTLIQANIGMAMALGNQPNAETKRFGHTVFIIIKDPPNKSAYIAAYNADNVPRFLNNIIKMCQSVKKEGFFHLVYEGNANMRRITETLLKRPEAKTWGARVMQSKSDPDYCKFIMYLGGPDG